MPLPHFNLAVEQANAVMHAHKAVLDKSRFEIVATQRDPKKYKLAPFPAEPYAERDEFIRGLVCEFELDGPDIAHQLLDYSVAVKLTENKADSEWLRTLASYYILLESKGARLPKFPRWVASLYPNRKDFVEIFSRLGQTATKEKWEVSGDAVDILRCADTKHFQSCFGSNSSPGQICAKGTGVCIIFTDDDKGKMKRRTWGFHVFNTATERDGLVIMNGRYGNFQSRAVAKALANKFPNVDFYINPAGKYYDRGVKDENYPLDARTGFTDLDGLYFDYPIWGRHNATKVEA